MDISKIKTFLTIVETMSLSKASDKLFVSQSTISTRLSNLEKELGVPLIKRQPGKKTVELTPKGEEFIDIAKRWMYVEKDTTAWITKDPYYRLNIGSIDSLNIYFLPNLYKDLVESNTSLTIKISSHSSVQLFTALESYEIDIALASRLVRNNSLLSEPIFSEGMVLISSSIYSNYYDVVHPQDLDVKNEIFIDWGPDLQIWHDYWWDPTDPTKITVDTAGLMLKFINIPESWAIVPSTIAHDFLAFHDIKISKLLIPPDERVYYKIIHRYPKTSSVIPLKILKTIWISLLLSIHI